MTETTKSFPDDSLFHHLLLLRRASVSRVFPSSVIECHNEGKSRLLNHPPGGQIKAEENLRLIRSSKCLVTQPSCVEEEEVVGVSGDHVTLVTET